MKAYVPDDHDYRSKARFGRFVCVGSYISLLLWFCLFHLIIMPPPTANPWVICLVHVIPFLAFSPIMISGNPRGHAWFCFFLILPFMQAVLAASNPNTWVYGLGYSLLVSSLFTSAMMYARWQSRYNKQLAHWQKQDNASADAKPE